MQVGDLFLALGLAFDKKQFNLADESIKRLQGQLKRLAVNAVLAKTDVNKAMGVIGFSPNTRAAKENLKAVHKAGEKIVGVFDRITVVATAALAGVAYGLKSTVEHTIALGSTLNGTAQKTGLSTDALQEFGFAAIQNSSSAEQMADGVKKLSKGLVDAGKSGEGPAVDGLNALGISMSDPAVKSKDLEKLLYLVAARFETMPDGAVKTAAAMNLFGKSGADLIPTLNLGVRGLSDLRAKAHAVGYVMGRETVSSLATLGDKLDESKVIIQALKNQAVAALVPVLLDMVKGFDKWVEANQELIRTTIKDLVVNLADALKVLVKVVVFLIKHWRVFVTLLIGANIIKGIAALISVVRVLGTVFSATGLKAATAWVMAMGPIPLIIAAVVAVGLIIYKFRKQIWEALQAVGQAFKDLWQAIKDFGASIVDVFVGIGESIVDAFRRAFNWVADKAAATVDAIRNAPVIKQVVDYVAGEQPTGPSFTEGSNRAFQGASVGGRATVPVASRSTGVQQTNSYAITVHAGNANAKDVATMVDQKIREHDENSRRRMAATLGVE